MLRNPSFSLVMSALISVLIVACSSSDSSGPQGSGGTINASKGGGAGSVGTGGAVTTGGNAGSTSAGGSSSKGGSGGSSTTGGSAGEGGTGEATGGSAGEPVEDASVPDTEPEPSGACTNAADSAIINDPSVGVTAKVQQCASDNMGGEPGTKNCIKQQTGLSDACVACFDGAVACTVKNCMMKCAVDSEGQACKDCRAQFCDPVFEACSGLPAN